MGLETAAIAGLSPGSSEQPTAGLVRDGTAFLRDYRWPIAVAIAAAILAHGSAIVNHSLSVDEDLLIVAPGVGGVAAGRPATAAVKLLLQDLMPLPFWTTALAVAFLVVAGIGFAFLLVRAAGQPGSRRLAIVVFLIMFVTLPTTANMLMWGEVAIAFSLGLVVAMSAVLFAWLWAIEGWTRTAAITSGLIAFVTINIYQAQVFVVLAGLAAVNVAYLLRPVQLGLRANARLSLRLFAPALLGGVLGGVISFLLVTRDGAGSAYHAGLLNWGHEDVGTIVSRLLQQVGEYAIGEGFTAGWVLIPTEAAALVALALLLRRARRGHGWWAALLFAAMVLMPFGTGLVLGTPLPQRAMHALPLVAGSVWFIWSLLSTRSVLRDGVLTVAAILLLAWQSGATSRLYHVELTTYEIDRSIATGITERLSRLGWDGSETPLVSVGTRPRTAVEAVDHGDVFGLSLFNEVNGGWRSPYFMQALGYPFTSPTIEQDGRARRLAESMPDWPADGAVALEDGVAIVRFAEPTGP